MGIGKYSMEHSAFSTPHSVILADKRKTAGGRVIRLLTWLLYKFNLRIVSETDLEAIVAARTEQLRKAISELEQSYDITLESLGDALDLKDGPAEGHSNELRLTRSRLPKQWVSPATGFA